VSEQYYFWRKSYDKDTLYLKIDLEINLGEVVVGSVGGKIITLKWELDNEPFLQLIAEGAIPIDMVTAHCLGRDWQHSYTPKPPKTPKNH
jgi:hypothetical protein